jgi:hypothetical protein
MRGLLLWALVILIGQSLVRLLSWSLLILIPLSVVDAWRQDSEMKWTATLLTVAAGIFLLACRHRLSQSEMARIAWLLVALLTSISVVVLGTEGAAGYAILRQPTSRLAHLMAVGSFVAAGLTYWRLIEKRRKYQRFGVAIASLAGTLVLAPGLFRRVSFEKWFSGALLPAAIGVELLLSLALTAGMLLSIRSWNNGDGALILAKWFEFSVIFLTAVMGLFTIARLYS